IYDVATGGFLENKTMPFVAWDVEWLNNGGYVFAFSSLQKKFNPNKLRYRLFFTDDDLNITKKLFPYKEDEIDPLGKMTYFSLSQEKIVFHWYGANYFSVIDRGESDSIKIVAVDFGDKEIPDEYKDNMEKINQGGYYYMGETPVTNGNYMAFDINNPSSSDCYLYSINDDVMKINYEDESMGMPFPLVC
ncbi:MAG: 6-bladed beta-propeller, partial [Bacteroidales bacterium]